MYNLENAYLPAGYNETIDDILPDMKITGHFNINSDKHNVEVLSVEETNPYYNPQKTWDGGGYHQPTIDFRFDGGVGRISDTSCGSFGARVDVTIKTSDKVYSASWGSMNTSQRSNIPDSLKTLVDEIWEVLQYDIPMASHFEELED